MEDSILIKMKKILNEFENLLSIHNLEDAKELLYNYRKDIPLDTRVLFLKSLLYIEENKIEEAKESLVNGISQFLINYDLHFNLNLARQFEKEKKYLKAFEMYELVLASLDNINIKKEFLTLINNFEKKHLDDIKSQHNGEMQKIKTAPNLHLLQDSIYCKHFIEYMNLNFNPQEHLFLILVEQSELKYLSFNQYPNVKTIYLKLGWEKCLEVNYNPILRSIYSSRKVFIHYLTDFICWLICRFNIQQDLYWIFWGSDVYSYINIKKYDKLTDNFLQERGIVVANYIGSIQERYRKGAVRRIKYILNPFLEDYKLVKDNFFTEARFLPFIYPNVINIPLLNRIKKKPEKNKLNLYPSKYTILLGNSGDFSNNHVDMLYLLKKLSSKDFSVIAPLSYGKKDYIKQIIELGKKLLGDQFIPLINFLPFQEYLSLINSVDIVLMNHNRQQAVGNILVLLYLGKKIYLKENTTTYRALSSQGFSIFNILQLQSQNIEEIFSFNQLMQSNNYNKILQFYNDNTVKKYIKMVLAI